MIHHYKNTKKKEFANVMRHTTSVRKDRYKLKAVFLKKIQNLHVITYTNQLIPLKPFFSIFMYFVYF